MASTAQQGANPSMPSVTCLSLPVEDMACASCVGRVERALQVVTSMQSAAVTWWVRWLMPRQLQRTQSELTALDGLKAETLKDIGAPEWMQQRARRAQELSRQGGRLERESLHWR